MDSSTLGGIFGNMLVLAPFGGTLGGILYVLASAILGRLEKSGAISTETYIRNPTDQSQIPVPAKIAGWLGASGIALGAFSLAIGILAVLVIATRAAINALF